MKVRVDEEVCAGFGICVGISPEVFELDGDDIARVLIDELPEELEEPAGEAAARCPSRAIEIVED